MIYYFGDGRESRLFAEAVLLLSRREIDRRRREVGALRHSFCIHLGCLVLRLLHFLAKYIFKAKELTLFIPN